jgi:hypothetical protein
MKLENLDRVVEINTHLIALDRMSIDWNNSKKISLISLECNIDGDPENLSYNAEMGDSLYDLDVICFIALKHSTLISIEEKRKQLQDELLNL